MDENEFLNERSHLIEKMIDAQRIYSVDYIVDIAGKIGFHNAINKILEPALVEIGEMWSREKLSLAQGYVAAKITEDILLAAVNSREWHTNKNNLTSSVVLANIQDDFHSLGRKMVGTFLHASGWNVIDMGNDVSASDMVDKAIECNASVIGVSAMMYTSALNIRDVRIEIDNRNLQDKIKLAVGGAIFKVKPNLVKEVGGDGTSFSAVEAPKLFSDLLKSIKN